MLWGFGGGQSFSQLGGQRRGRCQSEEGQDSSVQEVAVEVGLP